MWRFLSACATGLVGFVFPRLLLALGVPLESWIKSVGEWFGMTANEIDIEAVLWGASIALFIFLTGVETWKQPVAGLWRKLGARRPQKSAEPELEYIALSEAVMGAWERIRILREFGVQPSHSPEFASLRDYYERNPVKLPGIAAQIIFNSANSCLPIEGVAPPRTTMEVIPEDIARGYMFSDDATEMFDIIDRGKPPEQRRRYTNLRVKRTNIERRIRAIEEDNGKR